MQSLSGGTPPPGIPVGAKASLFSAFWKKFVEVCVVVYHALVAAIAPVYKDMAPYIALFIVIALLILVALSAANKKKKKANKKGKKKGKKDKSFWDSLKNFSRRLSPFSGVEASTIPRSVMKGGRCDNVQWLETGEKCVRTTNPEPIKWQMQPEKIAELSKLHPDMIMYYLKMKGLELKNIQDAMNVLIPWELDEKDESFKPKCTSATYDDEKKTPVKLWRDMGDNCIKIEEKQTPFKGAHRPKEPYHLEDYATPCNPRC